jgi:hypothetical protein
MAIAAALALVIIYQLIAPVTPVGVGAPAVVHVVAVDPGAAYRPPPAGQFDITSTRPMFDPARSPAVEPTIMVGETGTFPSDLSLVGVAIGGGNAVALLRREGDREAISARVGQSVAGWQLVRIERNFVVFRGSGGDFTLNTRGARGLAQPRLNNAFSPAVTGPSGR